VACFFFFFAGLMFSKALLSISVGVLFANWLFDAGLVNKLKTIPRNKPLLAVLAVFGMHVAGLAYTTDFYYAFNDLRVKLPLLIFPLIFATEKPFEKLHFTTIVNFFLIFVVLSSLLSFYIYLGRELFQLRAISPFMNHIRMGILTTIASSYLFYAFFSSAHKQCFRRWLKLAGSLWLAFFTIFILGSGNGVILFYLLLVFWLIVFVFRAKRAVVKLSFIIFLFVIIVLPVGYVLRIHNTYFPKECVFPENPPQYTLNGNPYLHEHNTPEYENGVPVYGFYCREEFADQWNKRSNMQIGDSSNAFPVADILVRYLSSRNLPKDSFGVASLTVKDIQNIEKGIPNYKLAGKSSLELMLYEIFRGYYFYRNYNNPNNNSLFMKFEFWKTAREIILDNLFLGVGTGDVNQAYDLKYSQMDSKLDTNKRLRAHNQYISITVALGLIGLLIFLFALIYPPLHRKKFSSFYFVTAYFILLLSMISEDTIETQIGVSIFSFFYFFFLFSEPEEPKLTDIQ